MYEYYNPSPQKRQVGDCVIRALSKAMGYDWERTYIEMTLQGFMMCDMPSSDHVWGMYLIEHGYKRHFIDDDRIHVYTVSDFCNEHQEGTYIIKLHNHVVCVKDGTLFDSWDSSNEIPIYYYARENDY